MAQYLFLGDSLTAGNLGCSFVEVLKQEPRMAEHSLINAGVNGFTMEGIRLKMAATLKERSQPEKMILGGGANDILLPYMQSMGPEWDPFIRKLKRHGSVPADNAQAFRETVEMTLSKAFDMKIPEILFCTIPCLGEDLSSALNRQRQEYNRIIKECCNHFNGAIFDCRCLDWGLIFEKELRPSQPGSSYLFRTPEDLGKDSQRLETEGEDVLCQERNLVLTIDGAHLNSAGARLAAQTLLPELLS
jgi:lysophospholipase L1-like esterase